MAIEIETYEETEVESDTGAPEVDAEALVLIQSLDLEGQRKLVTKTENGTDSRNPYPRLTLEQQFVFSELFQQKTPLQKYDAGVVPLRVLQIAAHANTMFKRLEVWHKPCMPEIKDPVLIGVTQDYHWEAGYTMHILARWGDALQPYSVLVTAAANRFRERALSYFRRRLADLEAANDADILENRSEIRKGVDD